MDITHEQAVDADWTRAIGVVGYRLPRTLYSLFWSMFGLVPVEKIEIKYPNKGHDSPYASSFPSGVHATSVVEGVGLFLFALYHVAIIIVLTNMLIAMMSHSFEAIQVSECPALLLTSVCPSVCPSVRPSVPCLRFSRSRKAVETNLLQTLRWAILTREQI